MALYEPCPCPDCGAEKIDRLRDVHEKFFVQCSSCGRSGPHEECGISAITAWNNLPRMSTIIAWQFQAAGLALENQRLSKIVDWLASWGDAHPCVLDMTCPFGSTYDACNLARDSAECWKEMARRAVEGK